MGPEGGTAKGDGGPEEGGGEGLTRESRPSEGETSLARFCFPKEEGGKEFQTSFRQRTEVLVARDTYNKSFGVFLKFTLSSI